MGIVLFYKWNEDNYQFDLYKVVNGEEQYVYSFDDREDILLYIEKKYTIANLIVRGN